MKQLDQYIIYLDTHFSTPSTGASLGYREEFSESWDNGLIKACSAARSIWIHPHQATQNQQVFPPPSEHVLHSRIKQTAIATICSSDLQYQKIASKMRSFIQTCTPICMTTVIKPSHHFNRNIRQFVCTLNLWLHMHLYPAKNKDYDELQVS